MRHVALHSFSALALAASLLPVAMARADFEAVELASGLTAPLAVAEPADGTERLFFVEQSGTIRVFEDGALLPTPFLDISSEVIYSGERGLLGLAFHPDYAENGTFYVNFSAGGGVCEQSSNCSIVARFTVSDGNPDVANPASRFDILEVAQPYSNHNGGNLAFGPDGYLYIGFGDGGSAGDPMNNGQNLQVPLGKMLRIDVDGGSPYAVPPDNPFVGEGVLEEIWAYGLRNPWRYTFDRTTDDLWIADVGQNIWEEIDFQPAASAGGENYGWRLMEGAHCYNPPTDCNDGSLILPVYEYSHGGGRCSVTGGYVYRGGTIPELMGLYLFADYCTAEVWTYDPINGSVAEILASQNLGNIRSFGEDQSGEIYICGGSRVWKLVGDPTDVPVQSGQSGLLQLGPGHPNPFTEFTRVHLTLDRPQAALTVNVFSVDGRLLRRLHAGSAPAGSMDLEWNGRDESGRRVSAGVYFLRAETGSEAAGERVILMR